MAVEVFHPFRLAGQQVIACCHLVFNAIDDLGHRGDKPPKRLIAIAGLLQLCTCTVGQDFRFFHALCRIGVRFGQTQCRLAGFDRF